MSTWAVSMVKDEADIIETTLRHMADEVDGIIVADNGSTDGTRRILDRLVHELPRLVVLDDPDPAYYQSQKMSHLAALAGEEHCARWIVPFDADEIWYGVHRISDTLKRLGNDTNVAHALLYNHFCSALDEKDDDPFRRMVWRQREPGALPKVAFRWEPGVVVHQGNHGVSLPSGERISHDRIALRHFPYRSAEQMIRKARNGAQAYAATDLPESTGAHWRQYGALIERYGEDAMREVFDTYFFHLSPTDADMVLDPAPVLRWR